MPPRGRIRTPDVNWTPPPPSLTEAELATLYDECNRTRFGSRLPPAVVKWRETPAGRIASTHPHSALGPSIWIHPIWGIGQDRAWVRQILLHEMCHVEVGTFADGETGIETLEHGPRWHAAMIRLHDQGEAWVLKDLANAEQSEREKEALLVQILLAMDGLDRTLPFHDVCSLLAQRFGRKRSRQFGHSAADIIRRDVRVVEYWSRLGGCFK
jgi:hypothetical protein